MDAFGPALAGADHIVLTDIYAAGEDPIPGRDARRAGRRDPRGGRGRRSTSCRTLDEVVPAIVAAARPGDVVITLGAGSIGTVPDRLVDGARTRPERAAMSAGRRAGRSAVPPRARQAGAPASAAGARSRPMAAGVGVAAVAARSYAVYRGVGVRRARARAAGRRASSCAATSGCRRARCWRCSSGLRGESLRVDRPRARGAGGCWRRRGCATPRCAARCRRRSRWSSRSGSRSASGASTARCTSSTSAASSSTSTGRSTRISICRSSTASSAPTADGGALTDEARAELAARVIAALGAQPAIARRLSQIDVSDLHNAAVILNGDPAVLHLGDDQFLPRLAVVLRAGADAARAGGRHRLRRPAVRRSDLRAAGREDGRRRSGRREAAVNRRAADEASEAAWREKSGIWSGWTSARRR